MTLPSAPPIIGPPTRSQEDLRLWQAWKAMPTDMNLSALLRQVDPLVQSEANKWAGTLARPLLEAEGRRLAVEAFKTYDPNRGAALGTHVSNSLKKVSRLSYSNQNIARLPENKMLMFHSHNVAHAELKDQFGRDPSTDELADHLGWSIGHLERFRKQALRPELLESGGVAGTTAPFEADGDDHIIDFIHHDLPPMQKAIFEHTTGYRGAEVLTPAQQQKKLKLTQGQYSYNKTKMVASIDKTMGRR